MQKKVIAVVGAKGKMGACVCKKLQNYYKILEIDIDFPIKNAKSANLIIDFACAESSVNSAEFCCENNIPLIIGSTGQSEEQMLKIYDYTKNIPTLICKNFSVGIFLQKKLSEIILSLVDPSITILEKHHIEKKDCPSGTAIELENFIKKKYDREIPILSERGGREIGTHDIDFYFGNELISVKHQAFSRDAFADGVMIAAEFMLMKKESGQCDFMEILEEYIKSKN